MAKPRETEPAADPLAALESAALAARHALDAKAAALTERRKALEAEFRAVNRGLGEIAAERLTNSAAYHAERGRLAAKAA